jgi:RimJ/RimL family protein N-acetyltransferase
VKAPLLFVGGTIATPRLDLEALAIDHAARMYEGFADPRLYEWVDAAPPADVSELVGRFAGVVNPYQREGELWINWAIVRREDAAAVGVVEVTLRSDRIAYLACYVFPRHTREGYAREACAAAIDHLWRAYDAQEVRIEMDYRNVPARCLAESLGFERRRHVKRGTLRGRPAVGYGYRLRRPVS